MVMKILIEYNSSWRNSFLKGSNDGPFTAKRDFKASSKSKEGIDQRDITKNTVLGILSRLIGDQRKLFQAKASSDFYFRDMNINFFNHHHLWDETTYLINKSESRPAQSSFIGVLPNNEPLFFSEYSATLWSVLDLDFCDLLDFILDSKLKKIDKEVSTKHVLNRIQFEIEKMDKIMFIEDEISNIIDKLDKEYSKPKPSKTRIENLQKNLEKLQAKSKERALVEFETKLKLCINKLKEKFPNQEYQEKNKSVFPIRLYSGALYIVLERLKNSGVDISELLTDRGTIKGFSKRSFNGVRDFLNSLMGNKTITTKTPYNLTKANGQLEINLDIGFDKAIELKQMIENAGVSSFYLGKKGLAYVSNIDIR